MCYFVKTTQRKGWFYDRHVFLCKKDVTDVRSFQTLEQESREIGYFAETAGFGAKGGACLDLAF